MEQAACRMDAPAVCTIHYQRNKLTLQWHTFEQRGLTCKVNFSGSYMKAENSGIYSMLLCWRPQGCPALISTLLSASCLAAEQIREALCNEISINLQHDRQGVPSDAKFSIIGPECHTERKFT